MELTTQQKVISIYSQMLNDLLVYTSQIRFIHGWFYEQIKGKHKFLESEDLKFEWDRSYPYSKDLDHINSILRIVAGPNGSIRDFCREYFEREVKQGLDIPEVQEIKKLSESLESYLKENN